MQSYPYWKGDQLVMHLAICDDHIADRKQMERLLGRESDRRIPTSGVLYVDSYGSEQSILATPMIYDAIFMDMDQDGADAIRIANALRDAGTSVPIVFCCGKTDYRKAAHLPQNALFLDKPIQAAELSSMIDRLLLFVSHRERKLEFRNMTETFYLREKELLYARPQDTRHMYLRLFDGQERVAESSFTNFCATLSDCSCFVSLSSKAILNLHYVSEVSFFKATLADGTAIRLAFGEAGALKKALGKYQNQLA